MQKLMHIAVVVFLSLLPGAFALVETGAVGVQGTILFILVTAFVYLIEVYLGFLMKLDSEVDALRDKSRKIPLAHSEVLHLIQLTEEMQLIMVLTVVAILLAASFSSMITLAASVVGFFAGYIAYRSFQWALLLPIRWVASL